MGSKRTAPTDNVIYGSVSICLMHKWEIMYRTYIFYILHFTLNKTEPYFIFFLIKKSWISGLKLNYHYPDGMKPGALKT